MIFDLQVKNIDFQFSSKSGASGMFLYEIITLNGQMWYFMTVSGILNCNCCNTVVCKTNFLSQISQMELSMVARLIYQELLNLYADLRNFAIIWKENECSLQVCKNQNFMKSVNVTHFGG